MKPTFNQLVASLVLFVLIAALVLTRNNCQAEVREALKSLMLLSGGYLFGSTVGSHKKDEMLANSTPLSPAPEPAPAPAPEPTPQPEPTPDQP